jgi:hypothetical protein
VLWSLLLLAAANAQAQQPDAPADRSRPAVVKSSTTLLPARRVDPNTPDPTSGASELRQYDVYVADVRLVTSMQRWVAQDGVRLRWDADKHVLITAPMAFTARSALDAITQVLMTSGIRNGAYPLEVCEYPNKPALLRITRQGEQTKDCPG